MNIKFINGNGIKLLAAVLMLIDHIGMFFFPSAAWLRCIGRISLPLFAYMLSEGCRYTKNKLAHVALLAASAAVCQAVYYIVNGTLEMCILVTFTLSTLNIYAMQHFKRCALSDEGGVRVASSGCVFICMVFLTLYLNSIDTVFGVPFRIEYGFWGCMLPVFASAFDFYKMDAGALAALDCRAARLACFFAGMFMLALTHHIFRGNLLQWFSLLAVIPLMCYNGSRGRLNLKYFFYIFYPAHISLFYIISCLI